MGKTGNKYKKFIRKNWREKTI